MVPNMAMTMGKFELVGKQEMLVAVTKVRL